MKKLLFNGRIVRRVLIAALSISLFLITADAFVAYRFSFGFERKIRRLVSERVQAPVTFRKVRVHPLFFSVSARDVEVFDPEKTQLRVLYGERVSARLDIFSFIFKHKIYLSQLRFEKFRMKAVQDVHGVLNLEKILEPAFSEKEGAPAHFHGWKHKDWFFNGFARIKFAASRESILPTGQELLFKIGDVQLADGLLVLTDHIAKPVVFRRISLEIKNARWFRSGIVRLDSVSAQGEFKTSRRGRFKVWVKREKEKVRVLAELRDLDLVLLKPAYIKTSPVYFDKGFVTWTSSSHLDGDSLFSNNRLRIDDCMMKSTVGWSPESEAVIRALNHHSSFEVNFKVIGGQNHVSFQGFEESLADILKNDFNKNALRMIRKRTSEELDKFATELAH